MGTKLLQLTLKELFNWRYMQTDPNWCAWQWPAGMAQEAQGMACGRADLHKELPLMKNVSFRRGNFLYDAQTGMLNLIDFGAARDYPPHFVVRLACLMLSVD